MKYIKKPVVIDAMQYQGEEDLTMLKNWVETFEVEFRTFFNADAKTDGLSVNTSEGKMNINVGDFIIRGSKGDFYSVNQTTFNRNFDIILGENLPEIYNQFPKLTPGNILLADRIAGKVDLLGNEVTEQETIEFIEKLDNNDFLSRRIVNEVDELGNPTDPEYHIPKPENKDVVVNNNKDDNNDFLSRRIAGEIDELGNPVVNENNIDDEVLNEGLNEEPINEPIEVTNIEPTKETENKPVIKQPIKKSSSKKNKKK